MLAGVLLERQFVSSTTKFSNLIGIEDCSYAGCKSSQGRSFKCARFAEEEVGREGIAEETCSIECLSNERVNCRKIRATLASSKNFENSWLYKKEGENCL